MIAFELLLIDFHVLPVIALNLSDRVGADNQIFQKFLVNFPILAKELFIGNDLIPELRDLRMSPGVV